MKSEEKWLLLFEDKRFRSKSPSQETDTRNPFENDYGRLISSSPIRRLQDKTQVFPLEQSDYIRTRLTHSLEVSYISSSIGQSIEAWLTENKYITEKYKGYLSSLLRVSGLIHDLGNPPFGHFGEESVKQFFKDYFKSDIYNNQNKYSLTDLEKADFENFDGNVQTLRILSKLYYFGDSFGYNLTFSTLASCIKYPSNSLNGNKGKADTKIAHKKFGYFCSEEKLYNEIDKYLKLNNNRSPIVYLMESADDIAYSAADIEDGIKLGIVNIEKVRKIFIENLENNKEAVITKIDEIIAQINNGLINESIGIQKFRIFTQQIMIREIIQTFKNEYENIMAGELQKEIIDISNASDIRKAYKKLQYEIFNHPNILKKEIAGWEAIYGLLGIFVKASLSDNFCDSGNNYESRLYKLISSGHKYVYENIEQYKNPYYKRLLMIVDFVSGMTDTYAINLYQELKGIRL